MTMQSGRWWRCRNRRRCSPARCSSPPRCCRHAAGQWSVGAGRAQASSGPRHVPRPPRAYGELPERGGGRVFPALVKALADHLLARDDDADGDLGGKSGDEESRILRLRSAGRAHHTPVGHLRMWLAACASLAGTGRGALLDELDAALALPQSKARRGCSCSTESGGCWARALDRGRSTSTVSPW